MDCSKLGKLFYQMFSGFVIIFSLPPAFEYILFTLAEAQTWGFIISKQLSHTSAFSLDPFTNFIHRVADVLSLNGLILEGYHLGFIIVISIYIIILDVLLVLGIDIKSRRIFKKTNHKLQAILGLVHGQVFFFWINIILIEICLNSRQKGIEVVSYLLLVGNNFYGLLGSGYSVSPFLTKTLFASENQNFPLITYIFRMVMTFFNFIAADVDYRPTFAIISLFLYIIQMVILLSKHPFYKIEAMKFRFVATAIGFFLTISFVLFSLFLENISIGVHQVLYVEVLLIAISIKIAQNLTHSISISYLIKYKKGQMKRSEDILKVISAVDYYMSPTNLKLEVRNSKLVYLLQLINGEHHEQSQKNHEHEKLNITEHDRLAKIKFTKICKILNKAQEIQKVDPILKVFFGEILLKQFDDFQRASFTLEGIKTKNFLENLMITNLKVKILNKYKRRLKYSAENHEIELFIENENTKEKLINKILASISYQQQFLKMLCDSEGNFPDLLKNIKKIETLSKEIEPLRNKLSNFNSQVIEVIPIYAFYLSATINLPYKAEQEINDFSRRLETNIQKIDLIDKTRKLVLADPNNIIIKFSMGKSEPGKILYVTENIDILGWEARDVLNLNITKLLPEFLGLNEKNLIDSFLSLKESYVLSEKTHFGFLANQNGFLLACDIKLFLYPLLSDDIIYIAFCRLRSGERFAIAEHSRIIALTHNIIAELQSISDYKGSVNAPTILNINNMTMISPMTSKLRLQLSIDRLRVRNQIDEKIISVFGRKYKFLTLHPVIEGTLHKFQTINSGNSSSSDPSNVSEGKKIWTPKKFILQSKRKSSTPHPNNSLEPSSPRVKNKLVAHLEKSIFNRSFKLSSMARGSKDRIKVAEQKPANIDSSVHTPNNTKYYRKIQTAIEYKPIPKFSKILSLLNRVLFLLSSILLLVYYFYVNKEFSNITRDINAIHIIVKHLKTILEIKRLTGALYYTSAGTILDNRFTMYNSSIYDPRTRIYIKSFVDSLSLGHQNFTSNFENYNSAIMDYYFEEVIPIRQYTRTEPPSIYFSIPTFLAKMIDISRRIFSSDERFSTTNRDLLFIMNNSNDELLLQLEKIVEAAYDELLYHIDYIVELIGVFTGIISVLGTFNILMLAILENRTNHKKRYLLTMLSLLEDKEILRIEKILSEFLLEAKRINPKTIAIMWHDKVMDDEPSDLAKKNAKNLNSSLKKYGTLNLSKAGVFKTFVILLLLVIFMILPFFIMMIIFISSGEQDHLKRLASIQVDTERYYYKLRQLLTNSYDYFAFNGTTTWRNQPIGKEIDILMKDLEHFQSYLVRIKPEFNNDHMNFLISGNLCSYFMDPFCPALANGAAMRGIIGINSFHLSVLSKLKSEFDASPRSFLNIFLSLNNADIINNEYLDGSFNSATYDMLITTQFNVTKDLIEKVKSDIIYILIIFFAINLSFGGFFTKALGIYIIKEREGWVLFAKRIPFKVAINSKIWLAYLSDHNKRNFE